MPADLVPHVGALQWAEGVILVYPTWWYAQPAILKGWMDRVWRPGIAFTLRTPTAPLHTFEIPPSDSCVTRTPPAVMGVTSTDAPGGPVTTPPSQ